MRSLSVSCDCGQVGLGSFQVKIQVLALVAVITAFADEPPEKSAAVPDRQFHLHGYATINYRKFNWETDPGRRAQMDLERLAVEPEVRFGGGLRFEAEVEFEHGGTGSTMEFDRFEEFGEFETEIEKGGEIVLEKLCLVQIFHPAFNIRLGHFFVPVGLSANLDEPSDYFTVLRSETERTLLPNLWHETGVEVFGGTGTVRYQVQVVNGLDATGFSSANWVARGHQGRFETVNAENLALAARISWAMIPGIRAVISGYGGNTTGNRPKPDMPGDAYVGMAETHLELNYGPFSARTLYLEGYLDHADAVSVANRNLSNNLNVKRTPVGSRARGFFAEAGYDFSELLGGGMPPPWVHNLTLFGRFDWYDTMADMPEGFFDNPRWERRTLTGGLNFMFHRRCVLKAEYSRRTLGLDSANTESTFALGLGLEY